MSVQLPPEVRIALDWARVWSPLALVEERCAAWRRLDLPEPADPTGPEFVAAFVAGLPGPALSLQLHALLPGDPAGHRATVLAAAHALGCTFGDRRLAPDHLAVLCELLGVAFASERWDVAATLLAEQLLPWAAAANERAAALPELPRSILKRFVVWLRDLSLAGPP